MCSKVKDKVNFWRVESLVSINENCLKSEVIPFITQEVVMFKSLL